MATAGSSPGTVLVTGGGKRVGRTFALGLADDGWDVAVHYNSSAGPAEEVAELIRAKGRRAATIGGDLGDPDAVATIIPQANAALGPLTALVNNASVFERDTAGSMTRQTWAFHMDINLAAPVFLSQAFYAQVPEGGRAAIVNMLDHQVLRPTPGYFSYTVSKLALWEATRMLAMALRPRVRVNGIGPGLTLPSGGQTQAEFEAEHVRTPLKIGPTPEDLLQAVRYFLAAPTVTGQMLAVNGGGHLMAYRDAEGPDSMGSTLE
ncbi:MAG: SDR family oxidoreductase [Rhodospirillaceae bacterium]|nr:SDR family oxidoreductase [Rhodospirillaceae bacterium]